MQLFPVLAVATALLSASAAVAECIPTVLPIEVCPGDGPVPMTPFIHPSQGDEVSHLFLFSGPPRTFSVIVAAYGQDDLAQIGLAGAADWPTLVQDEHVRVTETGQTQHLGIDGYVLQYRIETPVWMTSRSATFDVEGGVLLVEVRVTDDTEVGRISAYLDDALSIIRVTGDP